MGEVFAFNNRFQFLMSYPNPQRILLGLIAFILLATTSVARQPNFVLIMADDLGYGDVGYQGGEIPTPNIDSITSNGVRFTDGYVTAPVCAPSRAGLMTGRYQQRFGFWDNIGPYRISKDTQPGIPTDLPILSERLQALGYITGIFGKTHGGHIEEMQAFNRWDEFYGFNNGASNYLGGLNRPNNPIFHNKKIVSTFYRDLGIDPETINDNGILIADREEHLTDKLVDYATAFIEANKDRPFLCYIPFNAPHGPFQAPKDLFDKYPDESNRDRRIVKAMIDSMDQNIGRVLETLEEHGLTENTLIVVLSDNGGHEHSPSLPLRGKKATYWEGGLRVPFCMQWRGTLPYGGTYSNAVSALDILPTFVTAAGGTIEPEWALDGVDLMPYLLGEREGRPHETLYWSWGARKAIRHGDYKAISINDGRSYELYNLAKDPSEKVDLSKRQPKRLNAMIKMHTDWESDLPPQGWGWNKRLGYRDPDFGKPKPYHDPDYQFK